MLSQVFKWILQLFDWLTNSVWPEFENLSKLALYDEIDQEKTNRLNRHLTIEKIKYKLGMSHYFAPYLRNNSVKLLLRHSHGITHSALWEAYIYAYGKDPDLESMPYNFNSHDFCKEFRRSIAIIDSQNNRVDTQYQGVYQEQESTDHQHLSITRQIHIFFVGI